jgi:hypothetical protein
MHKLQPTTDRYTVEMGDTSIATEFEVQAQLYADLTALGLDVRGELSWRSPDTREQCRFDLVIFKDDRAVEIIEVKSKRVNNDNFLRTRQARRYTQFGIPVTFIFGHQDADSYVMERMGAMNDAGSSDRSRQG